MGPGEKGVGRDPIKVGVIKKKIKKNIWGGRGKSKEEVRVNKQGKRASKGILT
jgi:hypothetical protein